MLFYLMLNAANKLIILDMSIYFVTIQMHSWQYVCGCGIIGQYIMDESTTAHHSRIQSYSEVWSM